MQTAQEWLTTAQAAEFLRVSVPTVQRLAAAGTLREAIKAPGLRGARFFHRDELARVAAERNLAS